MGTFCGFSRAPHDTHSRIQLESRDIKTRLKEPVISISLALSDCLDRTNKTSIINKKLLNCFLICLYKKLIDEFIVNLFCIELYLTIQPARLNLYQSNRNLHPSLPKILGRFDVWTSFPVTSTLTWCFLDVCTTHAQSYVPIPWRLVISFVFLMTVPTTLPFKWNQGNDCSVFMLNESSCLCAAFKEVLAPFCKE